MHALSVNHYGFFGGPHNRILNLAPLLSEKGIKLAAVVPIGPGNAGWRLEEGGMPIHRIPLHRMRASTNPLVHARYLVSLLTDVRRLRRLIRQQGVDLVIVNGVENPHAALAGHMEGIAVVWMLTGSGIPAPVRWIFGPLIPWLADAVMVNGEALISQHPGLSRLADRMVTYYPPVDPDRFNPERYDGKELRRRLNIPNEAPVVGSVGNINSAKGYKYFVQAAAIVKRHVPDCRFLIIGTVLPTHRHLYNEIQEITRSLGMKLGVDMIIYSPQQGVADALAVLDVYVQSSLAEGVATALLESMSMAKPVVATDVGGTAEVVTTGLNGFVVPAADPGELASNITYLLQNPSAAGEMGRHARETILAKASIHHCVDQHVKAFEMAVTHASKRRKGRA